MYLNKDDKRISRAAGYGVDSPGLDDYASNRE